MTASHSDRSHTTSTTGPELVARARAFTSLLATYAAEAERICKPVDTVIRALEEAEIFKLMVPRCYGGLELDLDTFFEVGVALGGCRGVIQTVCEASGAHAHFQSNPLQRAWRDINTLSCRTVFDLDGRLEAFGRVLLGLDPGRVLL